MDVPTDKKIVGQIWRFSDGILMKTKNTTSSEIRRNIPTTFRRKSVRLFSDEIIPTTIFRRNDTDGHFRQKFVKLSLFRRTSDDFVRQYPPVFL